jgi:hypothetical protein
MQSPAQNGSQVQWCQRVGGRDLGMELHQTVQRLMSSLADGRVTLLYVG